MIKTQGNTAKMKATQAMIKSSKLPFEDLSLKTTTQVGIWLILLVSWYCWAFYTSIPLAKEALPLVTIISIWSISKSLHFISK